MSDEQNDGTEGLSILLLGSREVIRQRLVRLLSGVEGLVVRETDSLAGALVVLLATRIDVLALDVEGGGLDLLPPLRALLPGPVFISLGADSEPELAERCRALGAAFHFEISREIVQLRDLLAAMARGR